MKTKLITLALLSMSQQAIADNHQVCKNLSAIAKTAIEMREEGLSMPETVELLSKATAHNKSIQKYAENMVSEAYDFPLYQSEKVKKLAVAEFTSIYYKNCMETLAAAK